MATNKNGIKPIAQRDYDVVSFFCSSYRNKKKMFTFEQAYQLYPIFEPWITRKLLRMTCTISDLSL